MHYIFCRDIGAFSGGPPKNSLFQTEDFLFYWKTVLYKNVQIYKKNLQPY